MRVNGRWMLCADGFERPVVDAHLILPTRQQVAVPFLLDTGADFTVVSDTVTRSLAPHTFCHKPPLGRQGLAAQPR